MAHPFWFCDSLICFQMDWWTVRTPSVARTRPAGWASCVWVHRSPLISCCGSSHQRSPLRSLSAWSSLLTRAASRTTPDWRHSTKGMFYWWCYGLFINSTEIKDDRDDEGLGKSSEGTCKYWSKRSSLNYWPGNEENSPAFANIYVYTPFRWLMMTDNYMNNLLCPRVTSHKYTYISTYYILYYIPLIDHVPITDSGCWCRFVTIVSYLLSVQLSSIESSIHRWEL